MKIVPALALALVLATPASVLAAPRAEGEGVIRCQLATWRAKANCDPSLAPIDAPTLVAAPRERVAIEITWSANDEASRILSLSLHGNPACPQPAPPEECQVRFATGTSPLVASLEGAAASGHEIRAIVEVADVCSSETAACELPPLRLVRDQPFHYAWSIVPS